MTAIAVIDLAAFRRNVSHLVDLVAPSEVMLAVKANAYGHGMLPLAQAALDAGAQSLAVLEIPAALALREAGITAPLFAWLHGRSTDFASAAAAGVEIGVSALWQLEAIVAVRPERPVPVHLKVDTGLNRNGAPISEWPALVDAALAAERTGAVSVAAAWSHLADTSPADDAEALARLRDAVTIAEARGLRFPTLHLAASSAGIRMPEARLDLVRFGIAAYGISPFADVDGRGLGLTPVMTLTSTVTSVDGPRATIGAGFGDGVIAGTTASVWARGARHPLLSVDVDSSVIGASTGLSVDDEVVLFGTGAGGEPTAEDWAAWSGTIGDEVVARVSARVERRYVDGPEG